MNRDELERGESGSAGRPGDAVCAVATVAIAAYLAGLLLAIATNSLSGSSALLGTIKSRLCSPLLVPAWLDLGYDYRLTYGLPDDADHELEIAAHDGPTGEPLSFPGTRRGEQAARWRRLARTIASGGVDGDGSPVAAGAGRGGFRGTGTDDVDVRVFRLAMPEPTATGAAGDAEQIYAARVRMIGGEVQLIKDEARSEVAPLVTPR